MRSSSVQKKRNIQKMIRTNNNYDNRIKMKDISINNYIDNNKMNSKDNNKINGKDNAINFTYNIKNKLKNIIYSLIHLFLYEKKFKNSIFKLNKNKKYKCYITDKSSFEKYKSFYEYEKLKNIINGCYSENVDNIFSQIPINYFEIINEKKDYFFNNEECKYLIKTLDKPFNKKVKCFQKIL